MCFSRLSAPFLISAVLLAQGPQLEPLTEAMDSLTRRLRLEGTALSVVRAGSELHVSEHGTLNRQTVLPIASASKWLATATVLSLVDDGTLDLDVPVARYVEELDRPDKDNITLRQCLSCTSGFPARLGRMTGWDSDRFADEVADASVRASPGATFLYGGVGFQVAAIAAERATKKTFHELFAERIARPVGMTKTLFGALHPIASEPGTAKLPWVAGGAVSSLDDYTKFVGMLVAEGKVAGARVLSEGSVAKMWQDQVHDGVRVRAPGFAKEVRYGLGTWIASLEGEAVRATDPGAFGFTPWIDLDLGIGGVFAVHDRRNRVVAHLLGLQETVREVAVSSLVAGTDTTVSLSHGGRARRYHLHVPARLFGKEGAPLVVVLHGGGGNGERIKDVTGFVGVSDREGFIAVFPDGTGQLRHRLLTWNSGGIPVYAAQHDVDDTSFLREVVADVQRRTKIDPRRVYATGLSNGGMMCHRLAREAGDVFAGVAVVAGAMNFTEVESTSPIGVMIVHGTADQHVLYEGGKPRVSAGRAGKRTDASVKDALDYYIERNGLDGTVRSTTDPDNEKVRIDTYAKNKEGRPTWAQVRVVTLEGGEHSWPGTTPGGRRTVDRPFDYDATEAIWNFFRGVRKGASGGPPAVPR